MSASLEAKDGEFFLNGKKIVLLSGAMHYFRIVPEYWENRLRTAKFCGLNCVETYVPWNLHEEVKGEFNFTGMLDLKSFIKMAHYLDLYIILRPGPYICSEWDFGGLPSWLLADSEMKVRSSYKPYLEAVRNFFDELLPIVCDLQHCKGGPIICVQLENEYGSYGNDLQYMRFLKETVKRNGIEELLFTSDNGTGLMGEKLTDVLMTCNFQEKEHGYLMVEYLKNVKQPSLPLMVMEFWTGWFDHWDEGHQVVPTRQFEDTLKWILDQGGSVNFYMFHGGTNFGFMNGGNDSGPTPGEGKKGDSYTADVTSYDYDAPVSECGELTEKFFSVRKILESRGLYNIDKDFICPLSIDCSCYGSVEATEYISFDNMLEEIKPVESNKTLNMENLPINNGGGQSFGHILYRARLNYKIDSIKIIGKVKDRAIVSINSKLVTVIKRCWENYQLLINSVSDDNTLDILVENMGRVNYAEFNSPILNQQRKGIDGVLINGKEVDKWTIYPLEFKKDYMINLSVSKHWKKLSKDTIFNGPALYRTSLKIDGPPKDTFIQLKDWRKGNVFVNNFNLGRYWEIGPQKTLYLPAPLLKDGINQIIIFELERNGPCIEFSSSPDLGNPMLHKTDIPPSARAQLFLLRNTLKLGPWVWSVMKPFVN